MDKKTKTLDARLRRMAQRQGLQLHRSPRRDLNASDYGMYWIGKPGCGIGHAFEDGMTIAAVERYLTRKTRT